VVVTMGVAVERSVLDLSSRKRGKRLADWGIGPQCKSVEEVRAIRDEIEGRVTQATAKESKIPH